MIRYPIGRGVCPVWKNQTGCEAWRSFFLSFKLKILTHSPRLFFPLSLTKTPLAFTLDTSHCDIAPRRWTLTVRGGTRGWNVERVISVTCARLWPTEPQLDQASNRVRVISCYWFVSCIGLLWWLWGMLAWVSYKEEGGWFLCHGLQCWDGGIGLGSLFHLVWKNPYCWDV